MDISKAFALSATLLGVAILSGCHREIDTPDSNSDLHEVVFHADWDEETKTVLREDGSVCWVPGDQISLFTGPGKDGGYVLTAATSEPSPTADFFGSIGEGDLYSAIYPYDDRDSFDGTDFVVRFYDQVAKEGTFQEGALKSIAQSNNNNLYFKNLCGGIKFSVVNEGITQIVLHADTPIAGFLKFRLNESGEPEYSGVDADGGGWGDLVVQGPDNGCFEPNKDYYVILPAVSIPEGIKMTFIRGGSYWSWAWGDYDDDAVWEYSKPVTINRSKFKRLEQVDKGLKFHRKQYENAASLNSFLPKTIDKASIEHIYFHVKDATKTENELSASLPVYYEINGLTVDIYTSAELLDISNVTGRMFFDYSSLKSIDLSNTVVPNAESFYGMFGYCVSLESIVFGDWDTHKVRSMQRMFEKCEKLKSLDLSFMDTGNVEDMSGLFSDCMSLSSLKIDSFNTEKVTNMSAMFAGGTYPLNLSFLNTKNVTNMGSMFSGYKGTSLDLSTLDTKKVTIMASMFSDCSVLQTLDLSCFDTANVTDMSNMFFDCDNLKQLNITSFNTANVNSFDSMFYGCGAIENLDLSHFDTSKAQNMHFMFGWCTSLKNLDISSFTSESLQTAELMFGSCQKLQKLNLGAFDISAANCIKIGEGIMRTSKSGAIRCIPETKAVLEPTMSNSLSGKVKWLSLSDDISAYEYQRNPNLYYSSDYSKHETVRKLYTATKGKGIDIVLMGDVYSDRMIANGQYDADMELAVDAIFAKEPMASYKDYFNIYIVYLVSENEVIGESTALDAVGSGSGELEGYASANVPEKYRIMATGNADLTVQEVIVIINGTDFVSGYTTMAAWNFDVPYYDCDYGRGYSSVVVARGNHNYSEEFSITLAHEFGHSFAKLADEYFTYDSEAGESPISDITMTFSRFGWYKNVDVTSDPTTIRWSRFLSDERYANEKLGAYEGGFNYSKGVWRPNENSIMRNGTEFNAPSRAAIYNRIHKLAYGKDWQFDYETFVQQDLKNIPSSQIVQSSSKYIPSPARVPRKHLFKMEESVTGDGRKMITVIQD